MNSTETVHYTPHDQLICQTREHLIFIETRLQVNNLDADGCRQSVVWASHRFKVLIQFWWEKRVFAKETPGFPQVMNGSFQPLTNIQISSLP